jgi:hypothetical protein
MCAKKKISSTPEAQSPLIMRCHRLIEAFSKSDEEHDFFIDRYEGFLVYFNLDKSEEELLLLENEFHQHPDRYTLIPKLSYYETKKIMEGFINEKVYDIDTKEKLLDIIQSKEAKTNFLEFISDQHAEWEKWQHHYLERSRIRIIEWLRSNHFYFVFEEDLELPRQVIEQLKDQLFESNVEKEIASARKSLVLKAKSYYSLEALNPRPKRGRPPKQTIKIEIEPQVTSDRYTTIPDSVRPFLFCPEFVPTSNTSPFSSKIEPILTRVTESEASLEEKLSVLRNLSSQWVSSESKESEGVTSKSSLKTKNDKMAPEKNEKASTHAKSSSKAKSSASAAPSNIGSKNQVGKNKVPKGSVEKALPKAQGKKIPEKASAIDSDGKKRLKKIMPRKK